MGRETGLWSLKYYQRDSSGKSAPGIIADFLINPNTINTSLKQRVSVKETLGGTVRMPWFADECYGGYSRMDIQFSGIGKVYTKDAIPGNTIGKSEQQGLVANYLADLLGTKQNIQNQATAVFEDSRVQASRQNMRTGKDLKNSLLNLFEAANSNYAQNVNGVIKTAYWVLDFKTPFFSSPSIASVNISTTLPIVGYITAPMEIHENADNPYLPSWNIVYSIFDEDVQKFMNSFRYIVV